jgi:Polysulphide reductase, NrfD
VSTPQTRSSGRGGGEPPTARVMAKASPDSYYGRAVIAEPTWTWEIPFYFFFGGMTGAAAPYALLAELRGEDERARRAWLVALGGILVSPALLISDLGRPERFHHMLRVFKITSPMSVGSWILSATGGAVALGAARSVLGWFPRLGRASSVAAVLGPALTTYTAVLVADTSVPVWHDARRELPFVFAAGGAMSAGAAVTLAGSPGGSARRLSLLGAAGELVATEVMERRLGSLVGEPYRRGLAGRFTTAAKALTAAGALAMGAARPGRRGRRPRLGAAMMLAGAVCTRWGVYEAGRQSARDPKYVVEPQRARVAESRG